MTPAALAVVPSPGRRGRLLRALMAAVRPQFRVDVWVPAADDPVFGGGACLVASCSRPARGRGLCPGHLLRWADQGRPEIAEFAASTDPRWRREQPNQRCEVAGCGYGSARGGLCQPHAQRWERAGRPDRDRWLLCPPAVKQPAPGAACRIGHCTLWPQAALAFCHSHANTWKVNGRPDVDEFVRRFTDAAPTADETIRLDQLGTQVKLEMQYVLQTRHDQRRGTLTPGVVMRVVRLLATTPVTSMTEHDEHTWREYGRSVLRDSRSLGFLSYAYRVVADLAEAGGWEAEYPRDVWQMRRLGFEGDRTLRFGPIEQPWLREPAKRWIRWRISSGLGLEAAARPLRVIGRFSGFLARTGVEEIAQLDRAVLERYLADLHTEMAGNQQRQGSHIGLLNAFFAAIRQHRWDTGLPASAMFFAEDHPKRAERLPRALAEHVMAQLENPDNLDRWDNPAYQLVTVILMRCGLRVSDALRLPTDCVVTDADGAPYLRYFNHKMKRDALVPIDEELRDLLGRQRHHTAGRWPDGTPVLFPRPTKNIDGTAPLASSTYRLALYRWLQSCDIRDEHDHPVRLTPHQWRHTLGTRLINRDVPQEVVRRILDHDSPQMTSHYARLHDTTVRRHWEAARKVNIKGETVTLDPNGPLAEAAWAKQRLGRATQALPNGYCGLPVQKSCPHANACLTCPMFLTTPEFLPQHHEHRRQVLQIIGSAEARNHQRLAEMNQQVLLSLDRVIASLHADPDASTEQAADAS
ncbi:tyrosine-type recombinase/integrase [Solwaraspora sp. WMMB335]|uniref:tyrosine-type recombinase/integrase n=1 Tax=Solwaraspora sp. WMMB335 TaxID=3404118 RepID=UPI003B928A22